jgi:integrase
MSSSFSPTSVVVYDPAFADPERQALIGYLAGYRGLTRDAYVLDLRQFAAWCQQRSIPLFAARRADIEGYARWLEERGRARATVARRLSTVAGFYRYAEEEAHWSAPRPCTCGDRAWTTNPTPWPWIETRSAPTWWPSDWAPRSSTP